MQPLGQQQALGRGPIATRAQSASSSTISLLLVPPLDAAFDSGFITIEGDGTVLDSDVLPSDARSALDLDGLLNIHGLHHAHERYLPWHRSKVFLTGVENSSRPHERDMWRPVQ